MKRREFLKSGALAVAGVVAVASGVVTITSAAESTSKLKTLDPRQAETLLRMARQIYPHPSLDDSCYQVVVVDLDTEASTTPDTAKLLREGLERLNGFASLPADQQRAALEKIQGTPFFEKVRGTEVVSLYNNHDVWKEFGYQGPSFPYGGYAHRGFNDLNWLPEPPDSASPKLG